MHEETLDLMRDEFLRIRNLTNNTEIHGLCDRAISNILQHVPVIAQRDEWERRYYRANHKLLEASMEIECAILEERPPRPLNYLRNAPMGHQEPLDA